MQSGQVKHYNSEKGYGFIDADNQREDVFFHISIWKLSQQPMEGQRVYFNSKRNDKNQLRATEVTDSPLTSSLNTLTLDSSSSSKHTSTGSNQNNDNGSNHRSSPKRSNKDNSNKNSHSNRKSHGQNTKGWKSTAISILTVIAIVFFGYTELKPTLFDDEVQSSSMPSPSYVETETDTSSITGDPQIDQTVALIQQGGPFPYPHKDGTTFYNREGRLPTQSQGYYREYTVPTPGVSHRGARRIVTGGNPPTVYYLTIDHYDSFTKLDVN